MRYTQAEKMEIIRLVENSELSIRETLRELAVPQEFVLSLVRPLSGRRIFLRDWLIAGMAHAAFGIRFRNKFRMKLSN